MTDAEPRTDPCQRLVFSGLLDFTGHRCGLPEDDDLHEATRTPGVHPYDPTPAEPAADFDRLTEHQSAAERAFRVQAAEVCSDPTCGHTRDRHADSSGLCWVGYSYAGDPCPCMTFQPPPVYRLASRTAGDVVTTHDPATCDECWDNLVAARMTAALWGPDPGAAYTAALVALAVIATTVLVALHRYRPDVIERMERWVDRWL